MISLTLLLTFCALLVPLPMAGTDPSNGKDKSVPFPCQDRPCGCATAEQCWTGCCCFTNVEKVAWARRNGVTIPAYVVEAAKKELDVTDSSPIRSSVPSDVPGITSASAAGRCRHCGTGAAACVTKSGERSACCEIGECQHLAGRQSLAGVLEDWLKNALSTIITGRAETAAANDSESTAVPRSAVAGHFVVEEHEPNAEPVASNRRARYLHGWFAMQCRGLSSAWDILSVTMIPEHVPAPQTPFVCRDRLLVSDESLPDCCMAAPDPPPRLVLSRLLRLPTA